MGIFMVTYTSGHDRSAGDVGFLSKCKALREFLSQCEDNKDQPAVAVNLQAHTQEGGIWNIRVLAAKYAFEADVRILPAYFATRERLPPDTEKPVARIEGIR